MAKAQNLFFSCVDSRIEDQGVMYARFHLGTFFQGQALTLANALRRTLVSEIPGVKMTDIVIEGANHEFATLPGVEETVFEILLNLKNLVFAPCGSKITDLENLQASGFLKKRGAGKLTAADIKLTPNVRCINPSASIATLTSGEEFSLRFNLSVSTFSNSHQPQLKTAQKNQAIFRQFHFESFPTPIQKVNYVIKALNTKQGSEFLILEVWTDGSILPQESVQFALKKLTHLFYQFASMKNFKEEKI